MARAQALGLTVLLLGLQASCASGTSRRALLSGPQQLEGAGTGGAQRDADGFFTNGRATWFEHPHTGSCGYGRLDGYAYGADAVAALPDVSPFYNSSCGRCFELKCRGIRALSADGSVDLDRSDACTSASARIVVKIVDTCPCVGNEKWCCGDKGLQHFDLSDKAFARLAPQGKGIIGLAWRPVPCEAREGGASPQDWQALQQAIGEGASPRIFVGGELGAGWRKIVYGDDLAAMYSYNSSIVGAAGGQRALCTTVKQYGGATFAATDRATSVFANAEAVQFWAAGAPGGGPAGDLVVRLGDIQGPTCVKELPLSAGATGEVEGGWARYYFPTAAFECKDMGGGWGLDLSKVNRIQWENKQAGKQAICLRDVQIVPKTSSSVAAAGRR